MKERLNDSIMHIVSENSFKEFAIREQDIELYEFNKAIQILEYVELNSLDEGMLGDLMSNVSSAIAKKIDFIKEIAEISGNKIKDILIMFKDSRFFKLFKTLGFSIKKIVTLFKKGIATYKNIQNILSEKIAELGGVKYIKNNLDKLDAWFNEHPILKKIGGLAVAGLLLYIWLNMSYDPIDVEYSLSFEDMIKALSGQFSLADLFAGSDGIKMLIYLVIGITTGGVWYYPGSQASQILMGVIYGAWKTIIKDKSVKIPRPKLKKRKI